MGKTPKQESRSKVAPSLESLQVRRLVNASPERVFAAWTEPKRLKQWWGPIGVRCLSADVDLRVGGQYRIANELPDGSVLWIVGEFEVIDPPYFLVYTWTVRTTSPSPERVSVRFEKHNRGTEVVILHELISTKTLSDQHELGWNGCLDGLGEHVTRATSAN